MADKQLTFGSLFAGIGGFDLGFERSGMICRWQVEIDPYCQRVLTKHWPDVPKYRDIRDCGAHNLEPVDVICGGDPCQGNSNANSVHNRAHPDMGSEFVRIIDALSPRLVIRENPSVTKSDALWPWRRMRSEMERLGYAVMPIRIRATSVGGFHKRCRMLLIGERPNANSIGLQGFDGEGITPRHAGRMGVPALPAFTPLEDMRSSSAICGAGNGVPSRVDRLRCLGNAVVPQVAEWIGRAIVEAHSSSAASPLNTADRRRNSSC
jgi:DNA (cytosine-5)-methyltransferase 1